MISVEIGGSAESWVVRMMFCSTLGVGFSDPSGRICQLVDEYERSGGDPNVRFAESDWKNTSLKMPLLFLCIEVGLVWLINDQVPRAGLANTMSVPRFDKMSFSQ